MFQKLTRFMLSKKSLPVLILALFAGILIASSSWGTGNPPSKYEKIFRQVGEMLEDAHYSPKKIDDNFSKDIFRKYLGSLDEEKNIFLQSDIQQLKKYEASIDDEIHGASIQFFPLINKIYISRLDEVSGYYKDILSKPFNYTTDEQIILDPDKLDYLPDEAARRESWRKRLKFMVLQRYTDLLDDRENNKNKKDYVVKSDAELEKEAREKVMKIMERNFEKKKIETEEDRFNMLVNTITTTMDPHTTFFPPVEKRGFDELMSGRFFGIGASLRGDDGNIKIASLITGSPAWKSGEVAVGDIILKVAQGTEVPVDITGYDVDDAVKIIRGKKDTEVKLHLKKADGSIKVVSIIRDEIVWDEVFVRSAIINENGRKIGYIYLPDFYADWERPNGARSAQDVAREILKLKQENVSGIVMDLRNNGGGSLYDVVQMAGFFIEDGPIVQVKDRDGNPNVLRDRDKGILWDGPLVVMVNEFSASASEIFAAAIQDYHRGLIIGSSSTYGKGTVQRNIGLEGDNNLLASSQDLGTVKLTLQKFYRINGGSTQLKGVVPDIIIPDQMEYLKFREKDNPDALPWDEIQKANFGYFRPNYDQQSVTKASQSRIQTSPAFNAIRENSEILAKASSREYSLNLKKYLEQQKQIRASLQKVDGLDKTNNELAIHLLAADENKLASADTEKLERRKQWVKNLSTDIYLGETVNVMNDMISQSSLVKTN